MIEVRHLEKTFPGTRGLLGHDAIKAVNDVSFHIPDGGAVSFIGESGCGKTTIGRILAGLETYTAGEVVMDGQNLAQLPRRQRAVLLRRVQLIQQDPYQALNPARTIEQALTDPLKVIAKERGADKAWIMHRLHEVLELVGLDPDAVIYKYPHMLSGGQRQRIVIARALTVDPSVLVADEAVSMIDVSLRLGVLKLLRDLRERFKISVLFITHDVASARYVGDDGQMFVIYKGRIVEHGLTDEVILHPQHPYTQALLSAVPVLKGLEEPGPDRYIPLKEFGHGQPPEHACAFAPRCPYAQPLCGQEKPELVGTAHQYACHYPKERHVVAVPLSE
ncbi:peptide ABC transporter ATP-binding protein [Sulfobacillus thermotolerans]|uniref:Peptide ABC transporter ATP-binding protein n=1 Tax=Sulfobacillus thermotolerans TaxID=338644 RepID=A0ABN5H3D6_9FIRM|nr:peptide ABC transporter ATP-binding protein [Sulfobacillus thermotolerans]